jgi:hypothetical protein
MIETVKLKDLLESLLQKGLVTPGEVPGIVRYVEKTTGAPSLPWFVRSLIAFGAWTGAVFFVMFLSIANLLTYESSSLILWGLLFIGGAVGFQFISNLFCRQVALAFSAAGHGMLLAGLANAFDGFGVVPFASAVLCAILYPVYREFLHRFLSTLLVPVMATTWLIMNSQHIHAVHGMVFMEALLTGAIFTVLLARPAFKAMGYAMAFALLLTQLMVLVPEEMMKIIWWPSNVILTLSVLSLIYYIGRTSGSSRKEPLVLAALGALALGAVSAPGLLAAAGILALGYAIRDRELERLGLVFFPVFIFVFYYNLNITLLNKSYILAASGAVLLGIRAILLQRPWAKEAA